MNYRSRRDFDNMSSRHRERSRRPRDDYDDYEDDDYDNRPRRRSGGNQLERFLKGLDEDVSRLYEVAETSNNVVKKHDRQIKVLAKAIKDQLGIDVSLNVGDDAGESTSTRRRNRGGGKTEREEERGSSEENTVGRRRRRGTSSNDRDDEDDVVERAERRQEETNQRNVQNTQVPEMSMSTTEIILEYPTENPIGHVGDNWMALIPSKSDITLVSAPTSELITEDFLGSDAFGNIDALINRKENDAPVVANNLMTKVIAKNEWCSLSQELATEAFGAIAPESFGYTLRRLLGETFDLDTALFYKSIDRMLANKVNDIIKCMFEGSGVGIDSFSTDMSDLMSIINNGAGQDACNEMVRLIHLMVEETVIRPLTKMIKDKEDPIALFDVHSTMYTDKLSYALGLDMISYDNFSRINIRNASNEFVTNICRAHEKYKQFSAHELYIKTVDNKAYKIIRLDDENVFIKAFVSNY